MARMSAIYQVLIRKRSKCGEALRLAQALVSVRPRETR
jgi:hypothetical protein